MYRLRPLRAAEMRRESDGKPQVLGSPFHDPPPTHLGAPPPRVRGPAARIYLLGKKRRRKRWQDTRDRPVDHALSGDDSSTPRTVGLVVPQQKGRAPRGSLAQVGIPDNGRGAPGDKGRGWGEEGEAGGLTELRGAEPSALVASDLPVRAAHVIQSSYVRPHTALTLPHVQRHSLPLHPSGPPEPVGDDPSHRLAPPASPNFYIPKMYRKAHSVGAAVAYPGYDGGAPLYCTHGFPHLGGANASYRSPDGTFVQVGGGGVRGDEVALVVVVLLLWLGAISMFINRWGKLRMLEPYQPAYSGPPAPPPRPSNLTTPHPNLPGAPPINIQTSPPEGGRPKRIDSLTSFRDNFREGYEDAYRTWALPSKPFGGTLGIGGATGVWGIGPSALGIGIVRGYRRGSCGAPLGPAGDSGGPAVGSTQQLCSPRGSALTLLGGDQGSYHNPPTINIADTSITITNTDAGSSSSGSSRAGSLADLRTAGRAGPCGAGTCGGGCCCQQRAGGVGSILRPLASQIKVRSAVDLVTLVMQERRSLCN